MFSETFLEMFNTFPINYERDQNVECGIVSLIICPWMDKERR